MRPSVSNTALHRSRNATALWGHSSTAFLLCTISAARCTASGSTLVVRLRGAFSASSGLFEDCN